MIKFLGWCTLFAAFVAIGWFGREELARMPRLKAEYSAGPEATVRVTATAPRRTAAAPRAPKPAEGRERPERDNVGPGFATQGIGYYDVRDTSR